MAPSYTMNTNTYIEHVQASLDANTYIQCKCTFSSLTSSIFIYVSPFLVHNLMLGRLSSSFSIPTYLLNVLSWYNYITPLNDVVGPKFGTLFWLAEESTTGVCNVRSWKW